MERGSKREAGYVKSKLSSLTHFVLSFVLSPDQEKKPPGQRDGAAHEVCICCLSIPASVKASDTDRFVRACGQTVCFPSVAHMNGCKATKPSSMYEAGFTRDGRMFAGRAMSAAPPNLCMKSRNRRSKACFSSINGQEMGYAALRKAQGMKFLSLAKVKK